MVAGRAGDESLHSESLLTRAEEEERVFKQQGSSLKRVVGRILEYDF